MEWSQDIQHSDTPGNDNQQNDTMGKTFSRMTLKRKDTQRNDTQRNDTQQKDTLGMTFRRMTLWE